MDNLFYRIKSNCKFLTKVDLSNKNVNDEMAFLLADALKTNTNLKELHLCNTPIGDKGKTALTAAIKGKSIKLFFVNNFVAYGDKGVIFHIYTR